MVMAFNLKLKDTPFQAIQDEPLMIAPEVNFKSDLATVDRVKNGKVRNSLVRHHVLNNIFTDISFPLETINALGYLTFFTAGT